MSEVNIDFECKQCRVNKYCGTLITCEQTKEVYQQGRADAMAWIPCSERLPEEAENPITKDFYEYPVTYCVDGVSDVRYRKFGRGHWWWGLFTCDEYVVAWMPLPKPYKCQMKGETGD